MRERKFILMNLDDEKSKNIAEVISNKTCKKIISYLSDTKEASEKEISDALDLPMNTVEYNLKKLMKTGLIEKSKKFLWSVKGKRIERYSLSDKKIIISARSSVRGITTAFVSVVLGSLVIKFLIDNLKESYYRLQSAGMEVIEGKGFLKGNFCSNVQDFCLESTAWVWFLLGGLTVILIFVLFNLKKLKGGV